jgi:hypothetical protein
VHLHVRRPGDDPQERLGDVARLEDLQAAVDLGLRSSNWQVSSAVRR